MIEVLGIYVQIARNTKQFFINEGKLENDIYPLVRKYFLEGISVEDSVF